MRPKGFVFGGLNILYMEGEGKDASFDRWRITLYYSPNFAVTHFLSTEAKYDSFMERHNSDCYQDYTKWREEFDKLEVEPVEETINA